MSVWIIHVGPTVATDHGTRHLIDMDIWSSYRHMDELVQVKYAICNNYNFEAFATRLLHHICSY